MTRGGGRKRGGGRNNGGAAGEHEEQNAGHGHGGGGRAPRDGGSDDANQERRQARRDKAAPYPQQQERPANRPLSGVAAGIIATAEAAAAAAAAAAAQAAPEADSIEEPELHNVPPTLRDYVRCACACTHCCAPLASCSSRLPRTAPAPDAAPVSRRHSLLGEGDSGCTYLEYYQNRADRPVAVKYQLRARFEPSDTALRNELRCLYALRGHANVVAFLGAHANDTHLAIVMEHCVWENGKPATLADWMSKEHPNGAPEQLVQQVFAQLLRGVAHAHAKSVVHRDINPNNVLLQRLPDGKHVLKLCDFGSGKEVQHSVPRTYRSTLPNFTAPEVLAGIVGSNKGAMDIWSCGVLALTLLLGEAPFGARDTPAAMLALASTLTQHAALVPHMHRTLASIPQGRISSGCREVLSAIFKDDSDARPTAPQLLQHPWLAAVEEEPLTGHMTDLLARYEQQTQAQFDAVVERVCNGAAAVPMDAVKPAPGFLMDEWGRVYAAPAV
jgi:hypothetical protein